MSDRQITRSLEIEPLELCQYMVSLEGALLDERRWDEWLNLLTDDVEYWVPTWVDESDLADDPARQLSHVYYSSRAPLQDRILRIKSRRASACIPLWRSAHQLTNHVLESVSREQIEVRSSMVCHSYDPHTRSQYVLFGSTRHSLKWVGEEWKIARKKVSLFNDTLPPLVDIYML